MPGRVADRANHAYIVRGPAPTGAVTTEELLSLSHGAGALVVSPGDRIDHDYFARVTDSVKIVATRSVGFDHIDLDGAARRHIAVANTPGVLTDAVADAVILLLLGASRRAYAANTFVRDGSWGRIAPGELMGRQLTGKVLGIYGMGRIGRAVAVRARAFGMEIHYNNLERLPLHLEDGAMFHPDPLDLLRVSDCLTLNAAATVSNRHFLNATTISLLPHGAVVVNTARGDLIDDVALLSAVRSGAIGAVGLDVFEGEPKINPGYTDLPNAFLMPHLAAATTETQEAIGMLALDNVDAVLAGRPAPSLIAPTQ
jgi:lactate dehydrogenase-like 2-hydroxyacid dehydrogenase